MCLSGADAEAPVLCPPGGKRPQCRERLKAGGEGAAEDEMVGWHH